MLLVAPTDLRRCLLPRQISGVACCPTGVPGAAWCAVGPGCWLCPWAAARPRAVRAASFARRVASKPGQAPPPPTGTAARPSGPSGALHTSGAWSLMHGSVHRLEVRPGPAAAHRHRGRSLRRPSHQWGLVADVARCVVSKPGRALPSPINFARNSPATCSNIEFATLELQCFGGGLVRVVTNVVNPRCFSCGFLPRCYKRRQSKVFFVWISAPLLQTSSIHRLFR